MNEKVNQPTLKTGLGFNKEFPTEYMPYKSPR